MFPVCRIKRYIWYAVVADNEMKNKTRNVEQIKLSANIENIINKQNV